MDRINAKNGQFLTFSWTQDRTDLVKKVFFGEIFFGDESPGKSGGHGSDKSPVNPGEISPQSHSIPYVTPFFSYVIHIVSFMDNFIQVQLQITPGLFRPVTLPSFNAVIVG